MNTAARTTPDSYEHRDPEAEEHLREIGKILKSALPERLGFTLFLHDYGSEGGIFYMSSAKREDMTKSLREFLSNQAGEKPLIELSKKMNEQNNRSTQLPLFVVQEYVPVRWDDDGEVLEEDWKFNLQAGVFLTGDACDQHIKAKSYRYAKKTRSYGISAYNSYEMGKVLEYISSLSTEDGKAVSHYRV